MPADCGPTGLSSLNISRIGSNTTSNRPIIPAPRPPTRKSQEEQKESENCHASNLFFRPKIP